jgi:hypothetical protein
MNPYLIAFFVLLFGYLAVCFGCAYTMNADISTRGSADPLEPAINPTPDSGMFWYYTYKAGKELLRQRRHDNTWEWFDDGWLPQIDIPAGHVQPCSEAEARTNFPEAFEQ